MVTTASGERHESFRPPLLMPPAQAEAVFMKGICTQNSPILSLCHLDTRCTARQGPSEQQCCPPRSRATLCLEMPSDPFPFCQGHPEEAAKAEFMCPTGSCSCKGRGGVIFLHFPYQSLGVEGDECLECNQPVSSSEKGALGCCSLRVGDNGGVTGVGEGCHHPK